MAAARALAARSVGLTILLVILGHLGQALGPQGAGNAAVNPLSDEELSTSLVANQIALLELMQDASDDSSAAAAKWTEREEEAATLHTPLEEALRLVKAVEEGEQRRSQETLEALSTTQEALTELAALREEMRHQQVRFLQEVQRLKAPACPFRWAHYGSSCYLFDYTEKRTFEESHSYCRDLGGDIAKITSAEENQFIRGNLEFDAWIGLNDKVTEGDFVWTDGSKPTYTAWLQGEPNNYGGREDCVSMSKENNYLWIDEPCNEQYHVVCEKLDCA